MTNPNNAPKTGNLKITINLHCLIFLNNGSYLITPDERLDFTLNLPECPVRFSPPQMIRWKVSENGHSLIPDPLSVDASESAPGSLPQILTVFLNLVGGFNPFEKY